MTNTKYLAQVSLKSGQGSLFKFCSAKCKETKKCQAFLMDETNRSCFLNSSPNFTSGGSKTAILMSCLKQYDKCLVSSGGSNQCKDGANSGTWFCADIIQTVDMYHSYRRSNQIKKHWNIQSVDEQFWGIAIRDMHFQMWANTRLCCHSLCQATKNLLAEVRLSKRPEQKCSGFERFEKGGSKPYGVRRLSRSERWNDFAVVSS